MFTLLPNDDGEDPIKFIARYCDDDYLSNLDGLFDLLELATEHNKRVEGAGTNDPSCSIDLKCSFNY